MSDTDAAVEFRIVLSRGSDVFHDEVYVLDLDAPEWERFDLTYSEQRRCSELLEAAREIWHDDPDRHTQPDELPVPVRALLEAMIDIIAEALKRTIDKTPVSV
ncbi:hypothetical protein [Candidatus Poriferisodalis sp.]|uniref:hypothetical protein n=1 Tax=Candidatus Poriferisodalis sp. TaxID=3101277 RepID=UPI003B014622